MLLFLLALALISFSLEMATFVQEIYLTSLEPSFLLIWNSLLTYINNLPALWRTTITKAQGSLGAQFEEWAFSLVPTIGGWVTGLTKQVPSFLITFISTIMLSFFIGIYYERILIFAKSQLPQRATNILRDLRSIIKNTVIKYIGAILILMFITFVELTIGLYILGIANPIGIAALIAILDALPIFGTGAAMIPWCIVAFIQGNYALAGGLIIVYGIVTVIRNILEPKIIGDRLGINPIVSITAIFFGYKLFKDNFLGMIIMPMIAQIILELERRGTINIFKKPITDFDDIASDDSDDDVLEIEESSEDASVVSKSESLDEEDKKN